MSICIHVACQLYHQPTLIHSLLTHQSPILSIPPPTILPVNVHSPNHHPYTNPNGNSAGNLSKGTTSTLPQTHQRHSPYLLTPHTYRFANKEKPQASIKWEEGIPTILPLNKTPPPPSPDPKP
ncbi:hypothetical protein N7G274_004056 [Stereocaulon virgatum]|uniref:Uncharacterized protein n=1 Tax=Stereocaulon virgatum TaxID=373712 RepID=A0ABR4AHV8_9LECA